MSSCCLRWKKKHWFFFSFAKVVSFIFLVPLFWNFQECPMSQNTWCLIKTQLTTSTQTIFQGSSAWATLILNSMFVLGVHYCVQLLPGAKIVKMSKSKGFSKWWTSANQGIYVGFLWNFYWISMIFLWYDGMTIGFLWDSYGISMVFLWCFYDISMGFLWDVWGKSMVFLWDFFVVPMLFPCYIYDLSMGISVGFPWDFYDISMGLLWDVNWK